jgi:3-oxoadipate CoA-transferase beta subunit
VFVMMEHQTRDGASKIVERCTYPLTGLACVSRIYTDLAVLDVTPAGLAVRDIVDGLSFAELEHLTGLALTDATQARADDLPLITGRV